MQFGVFIRHLTYSCGIGLLPSRIGVALVEGLSRLLEHDVRSRLRQDAKIVELLHPLLVDPPIRLRRGSRRIGRVELDIGADLLRFRYGDAPEVAKHSAEPLTELELARVAVKELFEGGAHAGPRSQTGSSGSARHYPT